MCGMSCFISFNNLINPQGRVGFEFLSLSNLDLYAIGHLPMLSPALWEKHHYHDWIHQ